MSPQKFTMSNRASLRSRHAKPHGDFEYFPHTSNNTLASQHLAKPFRLKHPTSLNTTSLAVPRTNHIQSCKKKFFSFVCVVKAKSRNSFVCLKTIALLSKPLYSNARVLESAESLFIAIAPRSTLARSGNT